MSKRYDAIDIITAARRSGVRRRIQRHPAEVTMDRLGDHIDKWEPDGRVADAIGIVRDWLDRVASEGPEEARR